MSGNRLGPASSLRPGVMWGACLCAAVAACLPAVNALAETSSGVFRGNYVEVEHSGYLQPCDGREKLKLVGGAAAAELATNYAALANADAREVFVEVQGQRRGASLWANEIERIQRGGLGCQEVMRNSLFKALGSLPEWNLYIDPTGLRLRTLADGGPIHYPYHKYWRSGSAWVFDSHNGKGDIHVELRRGRCIDAAGGGRFGFTAEVSVGEKHYSGCAYPGSLFR